MDFIFIYITNPTKKTAKKIAGYLVKKHLIACANIFPIESLYRWEGQICNKKEYVVIAKTISRNFHRVKKAVEMMHPYEIPCIAKIPVDSNKGFYEWLRHEVKN